MNHLKNFFLFFYNIIKVIFGKIRSFIMICFEFFYMTTIMSLSLYFCFQFLNYPLPFFGIAGAVLFFVISDIIILFKYTIPAIKYRNIQLQEESHISHQICREQGMSLINVYELEDEGMGEIDVNNIDAFALGNVVLVRFPKNFSINMKKFIIGHELGHIRNHQYISAHIEYQFTRIMSSIYGLFKFSFWNCFKWSIILFILYKHYDGDIRNLLNIIPAYLSLLLGTIVLRWVSRQREFSCDGWALNSMRNERDKLLKGGVKLFDLWTTETSWFSRNIGVILSTHPSSYSRGKRLGIKFNSETADIFNSFRRYFLTIFGLIGFWVLLNSLDINIFTTSKVTTLATQLESELVDSILKRVYK